MHLIYECCRSRLKAEVVIQQYASGSLVCLCSLVKTRRDCPPVAFMQSLSLSSSLVLMCIWKDEVYLFKTFAPLHYKLTCHCTRTITDCLMINMPQRKIKYQKPSESYKQILKLLTDFSLQKSIVLVSLCLCSRPIFTSSVLLLITLPVCPIFSFLEVMYFLSK